VTQQLTLPLHTRRTQRDRAMEDAEALVRFISERSVIIRSDRVDAQVLGWNDRRIRAALRQG
jgi:hypothetical protein